jgi:hypothetical protein
MEVQRFLMSRPDVNLSPNLSPTRREALTFTRLMANLSPNLSPTRREALNFLEHWQSQIPLPS